jgi:hypothetical protein
MMIDRTNKQEEEGEERMRRRELRWGERRWVEMIALKYYMQEEATGNNLLY